MATKTLLLVAAVIGVLAAAAAGDTAGDDLINCPRDAQLEQCVARSFVDMVGRMLEGDASHDIPKADPLRVPLMPVNKNAGNVLNLNMSFVQLLISNVARDVEFKSVTFDLDKMELHMHLHRPEVDFSGKYKIRGKILWLPIWGSGPMSLKMKNVDEQFRLVGERGTDENGRAFWNVTDFTSTLEPKSMTVKYDNLFNGNWLLGRGANALMNKQWKVIYEQLEPITDAHYSRIMKPVWAKILRHVDLDKAFPAPAAAP